MSVEAEPLAPEPARRRRGRAEWHRIAPFAAIFGCFVILAIFAPWIAPHSPDS